MMMSRILALLDREGGYRRDTRIHIPLVVMLLRPLRLEAEISCARGMNAVRSSRPRRPRIIFVSLLLLLFSSRIDRRRISRMVRAAPSELVAFDSVRISRSTAAEDRRLGIAGTPRIDSSETRSAPLSSSWPFSCSCPWPPPSPWPFRRRSTSSLRSSCCPP